MDRRIRRRILAVNKFIEYDFAGVLVHVYDDMDRPTTTCRARLSVYGEAIKNDHDLVVTCLACLAGINVEPSRLRNRRSTR